MDQSVRLEYGENGLNLDLTGVNATIMRPRFLPGLADEGEAFRYADDLAFSGGPRRPASGVVRTDRAAMVHGTQRG